MTRVSGLGVDDIFTGKKAGARKSEKPVNVDKVKKDVTVLKSQIPGATPPVLMNIVSQLLVRAEKAADAVAEEVIISLASIARDFGHGFQTVKDAAKEALQKLANNGEISAKEELQALQST